MGLSPKGRLPLVQRPLGRRRWCPKVSCRSPKTPLKFPPLPNRPLRVVHLRSPIDDCSVWEEVVSKYSYQESWPTAQQLVELAPTGKVPMFLGLVHSINRGENHMTGRLMDRTGSVNVAFVADCVQELGLRTGDVLIVRDVDVFNAAEMDPSTCLIISAKDVFEVVR